jgi:hypothetical protein
MCIIEDNNLTVWSPQVQENNTRFGGCCGTGVPGYADHCTATSTKVGIFVSRKDEIMTDQQQKKQRIIRSKPDTDYFQMRNETAQDETLSYDALGVLTYLLSKPADWETTVFDLRKRGDGKGKIYRILGDLEQAGYVKKPTKYRDKTTGTWIWTPRIVSDKPHFTPPCPTKPDTGHPDTDRSEIKEQKTDNKKQIKKEDSTVQKTNGDTLTSKTESNQDEKRISERACTICREAIILLGLEWATYGNDIDVCYGCNEWLQTLNRDDIKGKLNCVVCQHVLDDKLSYLLPGADVMVCGECGSWLQTLVYSREDSGERGVMFCIHCGGYSEHSQTSIKCDDCLLDSNSETFAGIGRWQSCPSCDGWKRYAGEICDDCTIEIFGLKTAVEIEALATCGDDCKDCDCEDVCQDKPTLTIAEADKALFDGGKVANAGFTKDSITRKSLYSPDGLMSECCQDCEIIVTEYYWNESELQALCLECYSKRCEPQPTDYIGALCEVESDTNVSSGITVIVTENKSEWKPMTKQELKQHLDNLIPIMEEETKGGESDLSTLEAYYYQGVIYAGFSCPLCHNMLASDIWYLPLLGRAICEHCLGRLEDAETVGRRDDKQPKVKKKRSAKQIAADEKYNLKKTIITAMYDALKWRHKKTMFKATNLKVAGWLIDWGATVENIKDYVLWMDRKYQDNNWDLPFTSFGKEEKWEQYSKQLKTDSESESIHGFVDAPLFNPPAPPPPPSGITMTEEELAILEQEVKNQMVIKLDKKDDE